MVAHALARDARRAAADCARARRRAREGDQRLGRQDPAAARPRARGGARRADARPPRLALVVGGTDIGRLVLRSVLEGVGYDVEAVPRVSDGRRAGRGGGGTSRPHGGPPQGRPPPPVSASPKAIRGCHMSAAPRERHIASSGAIPSHLLAGRRRRRCSGRLRLLHRCCRGAGSGRVRGRTRRRTGGRCSAIDGLALRRSMAGGDARGTALALMALRASGRFGGGSWCCAGSGGCRLGC